MSTIDPSLSPGSPPPPATRAEKAAAAAEEKGFDLSKLPPKGSVTFDGTMGGLLKVKGGEKLAQAMLESIAMQMCKEMDKTQKKAVAESRKRRQEEQQS